MSSGLLLRMVQALYALGLDVVPRAASVGRIDMRDFIYLPLAVIGKGLKLTRNR
jgi:hypothetical protein